MNDAAKHFPNVHGNKLPTSFRLKKQVVSHNELMRKSPRSHGFHPSELPRLCAVKFAIYDQAHEDLASSDPATIQSAVAVMRRILDGVHDGVSPNRLPAHLDADLHVGDAIHTFVQYSLGLRGVLWGKWECPWCRSMTGDGFMPTVVGVDVGGEPINYPAPCKNCRGQNLREKQVCWTYVEPWIGDDKWGITGHADGILIVEYKGMTVVSILEIKSINSKGYLGHYGGPLPKEDHHIQASQYVACVRDLFDWTTDVSHVYYVYVNKDAVRDWKEFLVPADASVVATNQATMSVVLESRKSRQLPLAHRKCQSIDDVTARKCPVVFECFGRSPEPLSFFAPPPDAVDVPL